MPDLGAVESTRHERRDRLLGETFRALFAFHRPTACLTAPAGIQVVPALPSQGEMLQDRAVTSRLSAIFCGAQGDEGETSNGDRMEAALVAYLEAARAAWPNVDIETEDMVRYVASRTARGKLPVPTHAGDMLLAYGCALSVPTAIEAFYHHYGVVIARVLSRRRASEDVVDDTVQAVYERLLVGSGGNPPEIADYKGAGPLRAWVSTVTARTLLMMRRSKGRRREQPSDSGLFGALATKLDPELLYARERYRKDIESAISSVLGRLGDRERALLRLHLAERMSIDKLASVYKVNRATAARWLASARETVVAGTRNELRARLRLNDRDYDSMVAMVQSDFELSVARLLT